MMTAEKFMVEIQRLLDEGKEKGYQYVDITSGDVHRQVGGYPSSNHRMATCCAVMQSMKKEEDEILKAPLKGKGATLTIRYYV